jgi:hypothetical protein
MSWLALWERTLAGPVLARAQRALAPLTPSWRGGAPQVPAQAAEPAAGPSREAGAKRDRDDMPFLARWSQRKLATPQPEPVPVAPELAALDPEPATEPLPDLPALEAITADTDIAGFLAKGVSQAVRNAALRRAWSLDPAIRDYVGDARDYAYDWNVPGGVPGFGAIDPGYDIEGTLSRMFSEPKPDTDETIVPVEAVSAEVMPAEAEPAGEAAEVVAPPSPGEPRSPLDREAADVAAASDALVSEPAQGPDGDPAPRRSAPDGGLPPPVFPGGEDVVRLQPARAEPVPRGIATPRHGKATPA